MNITIGKGGQVEVILAYKGDESLEKAPELYAFLKEKELFKGNSGDIFSGFSYDGNHKILIGLGEKEKITFESLRKAFYKVGQELMKLKVETVGISVPKFADLCSKKTAQAICEGLLQSEYSFEKYLTEKKVKPTVTEVYLDAVPEKEARVLAGIEEATVLIDGIFLARDLVNEPAMVLTPTALSTVAKEELETVGIKVDIYGREQIEEWGMEAFLAVTEGSAQEPQFVVMTWNGAPNNDKKIALVGKGLTFDSGGYSLKPSAGMETMNSDMAGAASVIGAMKALALSKVEKNVVGIVATCENLISGAAYKPGDIIGSMSGKTIEVLNTDAEGRLTLADALWYAVKEVKADQVIDIATLTGACVVALGDITTGAITNNADLMKEVKNAAEIAGEPVWELPSGDDYKELIKGTFADWKNVGARGGGAITAGLFLQEFVDGTPWVHLDVAGTAHLSTARGYLPKGATGVPVKTLYYLVKESK